MLYNYNNYCTRVTIIQYNVVAVNNNYYCMKLYTHRFK